MSDYATNLKIIRAKYKTVGVIGMCSSGVQEFAKVAWQHPEIMYAANARSLSNYFNRELFDTPEVKSQFKSKGVSVDDFEAAVHSATTGFVPEAYEITKNVIFPSVMNDIINSARETLSSQPNFKIVMVECPLTTTIKYSDLFDAVVVITRPTNYVESEWYVQHFIRDKVDEDDVGVTFNTNPEVGINYMKVADEMFTRVRCNDGIVINNVSTLSEFQGKAEQTINNLLL